MMADAMCQRRELPDGEYVWDIRNFTCPRVGCGWHDPDAELGRWIDANRAEWIATRES